ncbi:MAG: DUF6262 family protein [Vallitaleaceae bacterium]|jgi:hypothetical protein|nr:DUF6262 family protein [Vallitaleaceae bacterium]
MAGSIKGLELNWKQRTEKTYKDAMKTIDDLHSQGKEINFNSVSKASNISKSYLYKEPKVRKMIEEIRKTEVSNKMNQRAKYDKTSKSKDVIIDAKDRKIAKLEDENHKLFHEIEYLRGLLYQKI